MNAFTKAQPDREWTVREVAEFCGLGTTSPTIVGTPEVVADELQRWREEVGVHGFNVKEVVRPDSLVDFVDLVVPELRERGLVPPADAEPPGETLRERLLGEGQSRLRADHPARQ
jgi:alkanesulfonate monooxygenase SsuD/methylene tetrahydromethanopterin reductase-like flavin-dependent oxidoreductase (luciferase family)